MESLNNADELVCATKFLQNLPKANSGHTVESLTDVNKNNVKWHVLFSAFLLYLNNGCGPSVYGG